MQAMDGLHYVSVCAMTIWSIAVGPQRIQSSGTSVSQLLPCHDLAPNGLRTPKCTRSSRRRWREAMCADAAADEQLAIAMMAGKVHEQVEAIFPNLRLRVRDLCHAVRRLGSRPTFADGYLKETMNLFLEGPAKLIEHSDLFKARFSAFVKELSGWSCKSLSAAKHRFESLRTPVGRMALHFEAVLRTCEACDHVRTAHQKRREDLRAFSRKCHCGTRSDHSLFERCF
eukprot:s963_g40.t1